MLKEDSIVGKTKIKWKGVFDLDLLYNKMKDWLVAESFSEPYESLYVERVKPDGKTVEVVWDTSKVEEDYFGYKMHITIRGMRLQDVEVNQGGKKLRLKKGTLEIQFSSSLVHDAEDKWKDSPGWGKFYEKHFLKDNISYNEVELYDKTLDLIDMVKDFLSMYSF